MPSSIIAATVLFTGLICHVEDMSTGGRNAVLVDATGHKATLTIVSGFASDSQNWTKTGSGAYVLTGEELTINGGSGSLTIGSDFDLRVPHVAEILTSPDIIHPDITGHKPHNSTAMISYEHGTLGVAGCFTDAEIKFDPPVGGKDPRCLAKTTELDFIAGKNWRIQEVKDPSKYIELQAGAVVKIENYSGSPGDHYKEYAKLLKNNTTIRDMKHTGRKCTTACAAFKPTTSNPNHGPTVECSNTQWP